SSTVTDRCLRWEKIAAEAGADGLAVLPRADEMDERRYEALAKKYLLVCLIKAGTPVREAIERAALNITESAARKLLNRYESHGVSGLVDHRQGNSMKKKVFTDNLKKRALAWWFARPAAGPRAIWKQVVAY